MQLGHGKVKWLRRNVFLCPSADPLDASTAPLHEESHMTLPTYTMGSAIQGCTGGSAEILG